LADTHTSVLIEELVAQAPDGPVDLDWLLWATWTNDRSGFCCCYLACW
jgi:hypothetical protein